MPATSALLPLMWNDSTPVAVTVATFEIPPTVAAIATVRTDVPAVEEKGNRPLRVPAPIRALEGTVTAESLLAITALMSTGAGAVSRIVHSPFRLEEAETGLHTSADNCGADVVGEVVVGAVTWIDVVRLAPPVAAVRTIVAGPAPAGTVRVKDAVVAEDGTVTLGGIWTEEGLLLIVTVCPPVAAGPDSVTVHAVDCPGLSDAAAQPTDEIEPGDGSELDTDMLPF